LGSAFFSSVAIAKLTPARSSLIPLQNSPIPLPQDTLSIGNRGNEKNAVIVLNCLKQYLAGDMKGAIENFADTVEFIGDQFYFKGKKDSLAAILGEECGNMASVSKTFDSWMTTYYPDQKDTWVTLWYVEKWTDKKGKTDSLYYTDDVKLRNGKILMYDEKIRRYPPPAISKK
jgi:hypothetical protein